MIIKNNEEVLRKKCSKVNLEEVPILISILEKELHQSGLEGKPGIGLAAAQIGISKHVAIIRLPEYSINLVNASIIESYDLGVFNGEGCLSFPDRLENTLRFNQIKIKNEVEPYEFMAVGLLSVAIQHELDHLNGVLFFDHLSSVKKAKIGPNDPCNCGKVDPITKKIKKYKKCCGK